jgi:hypothetical protein
VAASMAGRLVAIMWLVGSHSPNFGRSVVYATATESPQGGLPRILGRSDFAGDRNIWIGSRGFGGQTCGVLRNLGGGSRGVGRRSLRRGGQNPERHGQRDKKQ